jgi:hypothetical protein
MSDGKVSNAPSFPALVQKFFTEYLVSQRAMSPYTVAAYRDAMVLFLHFAHQRLGKAPTALSLLHRGKECRGRSAGWQLPAPPARAKPSLPDC